MPEEMTERKKELIEQLSNLKCDATGYFTLGMKWQSEQIADIIISRERRIVEEIVKPLKKIKEEEPSFYAMLPYSKTLRSINEALSKAEDILR